MEKRKKYIWSFGKKKKKKPKKKVSDMMISCHERGAMGKIRLRYAIRLMLLFVS